MTAWLDRVLAPDAPAFALLHRPGSVGADRVDLLFGDVREVDLIADIALPADDVRDRHDVLAVLPYRQIRERGFDHADDGEPLITLTVADQRVLPYAEVLDTLPDAPIDLGAGGFDLDDERYADLVRRVVTEEIGRGTGANFVLKRSFTAEITNWSRRTALAFFRRLLGRDPGAYWTFLVCAGGRTFVGSSPERHVSLDAGLAVMNPISGTYRYPEAGPDPAEVLRFLADAKEANELYMVLDEELKMMGRVCDLGARARGPYLKPMNRLAHTEYLIEGRTTADVRDVLRQTLFAPTVTGGPLESACRVISRYEPGGRGYYAGVVALFGRDAAGERSLDSAILIRTAEVSASGRMTIGVGATLVRDSSPESEAAETRAKAAGLLAALRGEDPPAAFARVPELGADPAVRAALAERNVPLADFWFEDPATRSRRVPAAVGRRILVVDAEDTFTAMARTLLRAVGFDVSVARFDEAYAVDGYDLVIVGPGPGDPNDVTHPKIAALRGLVTTLLARGIPFFAVCLGHQVLSTLLGLSVRRREVPNQGVQRKIDFFGRTELVGFYNTFSARTTADRVPCAARGGVVEVFREEDEVHALRGPGFASVQCHLASVLTRNGAEILGEILGDLTADAR
ncbi:phenazine biosynthesis protein PhzE [Saccharothrix violaceirubra]|uniref:anthranilate synthase n=1 Tax=Saccharothrix violaceirubra TaxID=413306 RepID=A0A7W7T697_9PSEU|nr:anthranilate synthase family protein [Saccharothrix violaceirubra]MBB4967357.1 phenazine biosynthesis protein phzE [Saccharothrix violaceirubra]